MLRVIRELHEQLMGGTAEGIGKTPGEFRKTQNWIGGTRPDNADFVPPPVHELNRAFGDFEKFLNQRQVYPSLICAALMHAQFETIHPFLDGNGRTGRLLITLYLWQQKVLEYPILYLSEYFKRHRCDQLLFGHPCLFAPLVDERWFFTHRKNNLLCFAWRQSDREASENPVRSRPVTLFVAVLDRACHEPQVTNQPAEQVPFSSV